MYVARMEPEVARLAGKPRHAASGQCACDASRHKRRLTSKAAYATADHTRHDRCDPRLDPPHPNAAQ